MKALLGLLLMGIPAAVAANGTGTTSSGEVSWAASVIVYLLSILGLALVLKQLRQSWRQIVLGVGTVAITLVISEVAVRVLFPNLISDPPRHLPSRTLHHIAPPNAHVVYGSYDGEPVVYRTNDDGFRTTLSRSAFLEADERIAVLGDSFVFGLGVNESDTLAYQLQAELTQGDTEREYAVLNAGFPSYSPFLAGLLFNERVREYNPTLVFLVLDATDVGDDLRYEDEAVVVDGSVEFETRFMTPRRSRSALAKLAAPWPQFIVQAYLVPLKRLRGSDSKPLAENYDYYEFSVEIGGAVESNRFFIYRHPPEATKPFFERTLANISRLAEDVRSAGSEFVLVVSPRFHHWDPSECPENWESEFYALDEPFQFEYLRFFDAAAVEVEFPIVNLLPAFEAAEDRPLVLRNDPHWTRLGHRVVARALASVQRENLRQ